MKLAPSLVPVPEGIRGAILKTALGEEKVGYRDLLGATRWRRQNSTSLIAVIAALSVLVACLDFWTTAELVGSLLFIFPIGLCALQSSTRVLWSTVIAATLLTFAAELWGLDRVELLNPWTSSANRGLLIASFFMFAAFIHLRIVERQQSQRDTAEIKRQAANLAAQNGQLEILMAAATRDLNERAELEMPLRSFIQEAPAAIAMFDRSMRYLATSKRWLKDFGLVGDLTGRSHYEVFPDVPAQWKAVHQRALDGETIKWIDDRFDRPNAPTVWLSWEIRPWHSADGTIGGVVLFTEDITERKDTERLLQENMQRRDLLEAAPDAMVVVNQDGEIVLLNLQAEKQFGYSRDELLAQPVKNIIPEGFAERLIADDLRSTEDALAQQIGTGIELTGRRKDGSAFPIEIMLSPLESAEGVLMTAAIRDISVRKDAEKHLAQMESRRRLAEEALRQSEEQYRLLLDGVQDHAIFMIDPQGRVVSWNTGAERIKGYRADQIIGRNFSCFFSPEDIERGKPEEMLRVTAAMGHHEEQGMRVRQDGSQFLASVAFTALHDRAGNLRGFSEFSHDLSRSTESEAKYRGLLEAAPDAMVVVSQSGEIVLLNLQAEKQFGWRRDELLGQQVKNIIPEGFAERLLADDLRSTEDAVAQQIGTGIELTGRRKDGSTFPIEIMLSPLESREGILVTAAIRDISARKAAKAALRELSRSNDDLAQFASIASHDLQEPLRMVASYVQLLSRRYKGKLDSDADEFIAFAVDGATRMQRLIQDLLAYSRVGKKSEDLLDAPSGTALQRALTNLRGSIEESGAQVTHGPLPSVLANETQLTQLFQNLIGNAIKYQGPGIPRVHISAMRNEEKRWLFSVEDNGLGIERQYFERIFGVFQRLHKREEFEGTGIGLAICKKIVERHGGDIWVESEPGKGSTFRFDLAGSERKS